MPLPSTLRSLTDTGAKEESNVTEQPTDGETPPWPAGEPDDSEPTPERQMELRAAYDANMKVGKPPYAGVIIRTRGEVKWIVRERGWKTGGAEILAEFIDLRRVGFDQANLSGTDLSLANLSGAVITYANFTSADLSLANLSGVAITGTNFTSAQLGLANLSVAIISPANFTNANLFAANLSGAVIIGNFSKATLVRARMDATAMLVPSQDR